MRAIILLCIILLLVLFAGCKNEPLGPGLSTPCQEPGGTLASTLPICGKDEHLIVVGHSVPGVLPTLVLCMAQPAADLMGYPECKP